MLISKTSRLNDAALAFECIVSFLQYVGLATVIFLTVEIVPTPTRGFSLGVMIPSGVYLGCLRMLLLPGRVRRYLLGPRFGSLEPFRLCWRVLG